jgi:hypothetical protein
MKQFIVTTFIALLGQVSSFCQQTLNTGIVAWYTFSENARDSSGNNNDPIVNNISFTNDRFGNPNAAGLFNGKDNYIRVKNSSSLCPDELTIAIIVKPMGFYNGLCYNNSLLDKGAWDYKPGAYSLRFTAGEHTLGDCRDGDSAHQNFAGMTGANGGHTSQSIYVVPGTWYYVVYTYSKTQSRLYIDGELISSAPAKGKLGKNSEDLFIGKKDNAQYPYWFNGVMDEIRIYKRSLSPDEVFDLYTMQKRPASSQ